MVQSCHLIGSQPASCRLFVRTGGPHHHNTAKKRASLLALKKRKRAQKNTATVSFLKENTLRDSRSLPPIHLAQTAARLSDEAPFAPLWGSIARRLRG